MGQAVSKIEAMDMRGQITLFMIIGVMMLLVFGFLFYVSQYTAEMQSQENIEQQGTVDLDLKKVKFFVQSCLEEATKDALTLAAMQGGFIYDYQVEGGYEYQGVGHIYPPPLYGREAVPYYDDVTGKSYNVTYAYPPRGDANYSGDIDVPLGSGNGDTNVFGYSGRAAPANLLPLCHPNKSNEREMEGSQYSCPSYDKNWNTQRYMELYIEDKTRECMESEGFEESFDYDVYLDNISVQVLFGEEDVYSRLDMPVVMNSSQGESLLDSFTTKVDVRYKQMYEYLLNVVEKEAGTLFYDLNDDIRTDTGCFDFDGTERDDPAQCNRPGFVINFTKHACVETSQAFGGIELCDDEGLESSFIILKDENSTVIDNRPFTMVVALGNRGPYIEKIEFDLYDRNKNLEYSQYLNRSYTSFFASLPGTDITEAWPWTLYNRTRSPVDTTYDIIVDHGKKIYIIPWGLDPDEDYHIPGFPLMVKEVAAEPIYTYEGSWKAELESSSAYTTGLDNYSHKDASFETNSSHVGIHTVDVLVEDYAGHKYTEEVTVQVRCYDEKRAYPTDETRTVNLSTRWYNGRYRTGDVSNVRGDYNFSDPTDPDVNDSNDCCDEAGGYDFQSPGFRCDTCHRCDGNGVCAINTSAGNAVDGNFGNPENYTDCPPCKSCTPNGNCDKNKSNYLSCNGSNGWFPGDGICCQGFCRDPTNPTNISEMTGWPTDSFQNATYYFDHPIHGECWNKTNYECITPSILGHSGPMKNFNKLVGHYANYPIGYVPNACNGTSSTCDYGVCVGIP